MDSAMEWAVKRERELRKWSYLECKVRGIVPMFECESPEETWARALEQQIEEDLMREAYPIDNPHHPDYHSVHTDIYDQRDGK